MSLINEALKRTRDASFPAGTPPVNQPAAYRVNPPASSTGFHVQTIIIALVIAVAAIMVIVGLLWSRPRPEPVVQVVAPAVKPVEPVVAEEQLVARLMEKLQAEQAKVPVPAAVPAPPPPPPVPLPKLTLQGITRAGANSEVMINGYTYRVGEIVEGAQISAIEDGQVRLTYHGQAVLLRLR